MHSLDGEMFVQLLFSSFHFPLTVCVGVPPLWELRWTLEAFVQFVSVVEGYLITTVVCLKKISAVCRSVVCSLPGS